MSNPRELTRLELEVRDAINRASREADSDTPDFILAEYLLRSLEAFEIAVNRREAFYGRPHDAQEPEDHLHQTKGP